MTRRMSNPNALKALEEYKMEVANEISIDNRVNKEEYSKHSSGMVIRSIPIMGHKKLIDKE